jgi:hypothetical protein
MALSCKGSGSSGSPSAGLTTYLPWPELSSWMRRRSNSGEPCMLRFVQMSQLWAATCLLALPFQSAPIGGSFARRHRRRVAFREGNPRQLCPACPLLAERSAAGRLADYRQRRRREPGQ